MEKKVRAKTTKILKRRTAESSNNELSAFQFINQLLQKPEDVVLPKNEEKIESNEIKTNRLSFENKAPLGFSENLLRKLLISRAFELRDIGKAEDLKKHVFHIMMTTNDATLAVSCSDFFQLHGLTLPLNQITEALQFAHSTLNCAGKDPQPDNCPLPFFNLQLLLKHLLMLNMKEASAEDLKTMAVTLSNMVVNGFVRRSVIFKDVAAILGQIISGNDDPDAFFENKDYLQCLEMCRFIGRADSSIQNKFLRKGLTKLGNLKLGDGNELTAKEVSGIFRCCQWLHDPLQLTILIKLIIMGMDGIIVNSCDVRRLNKELTSLQAHTNGQNEFEMIRFRAACSQFSGLLMMAPYQ